MLDPASLALALLLLPLLAGAVQLALAASGRGAAGGPALAGIAAAALAALALHGQLARGPRARVALASPAPAPSVVDAGLRRTFAALDDDRDGTLSAGELGRLGPLPLGFDPNSDGAVSGEEARAALTVVSGGAWLRSSPPTLSSSGTEALLAAPPLPRLVLELGPARSLVALLALLAALLAGVHTVEPSRAAGAERGAAWSAGALALVAAALAAAGLLGSPPLAVAALGLGAAGTLLLRQASSLAGAPLRVGVGTLLGAAAAAGLLSAGLLLPSGTGRALTLVTCGLAALVLPLQATPGAPGRAALAQTLWAGAVAPAAALLLAPHATAVGPEVRALLAVPLGLWAGFAALRALAAARLDDGVRWLVSAHLAGLLALTVAPLPPAAALVAAASGALALPAFALGADALERAAGSGELVRLGGLRRRAPAALLAGAAGAVTLLGWQATWVVPAVLGDARERGGAAAWAVALALALALAASAAASLRWALLAFGRRKRAGVLTPPLQLAATRGLAAGPLVLAAALAAVGPALLLGASRFAPVPSWSLVGPSPSGLQALAGLGLLALGLAVGAASRVGPPPLERALRLEVLLEPYAPKRRLVQPLLGLARRLAAADAAHLQERPQRALLALGAALARALRRVPSPPACEPSERAAWGEVARTAAALVVLLLALLLLARS